MSRLTCHTAGESHGTALIALVEGLPAGLPVDLDRINAELTRRQGGFGRGGRQKIEHDEVRALSGLIRGVTIGSPVALQIDNRDARIDDAPPISRPRPGHADFAGAMKWLTSDCRPVLERASARETAARTAAGALAKCLLREFGIEAFGFVRRIGPVVARLEDESSAPNGATSAVAMPTRANQTGEIQSLRAARDASEVYCPDPAASAAMIDAIRRAKHDKDTLGGVVEVRITGCPPGLGSCMRWQDKLDGRLMQALGSIQAIKAVAIGLGFEAAALPGSQVHDALDFDPSQRESANLGYIRRTNRAGGIEGGMTNGMPIILQAAMKPISTLLQGIDSVDLRTNQAARSDYERSDICAVPAASVVAENVAAFEIAAALLDKFGGDTLGEVRAAYDSYLSAARRLARE